MRVNVAIPEAHVDAPVLDAALEATTRLNEAMMAKNEIPSFQRALKGNGVRWRPEPPGDEHFDHAKTVLNRGWGDCDDLAPWQAASLRHSGEDKHAKAIVKRSGPRRWHAVVRRGDGSIDDPSLRAGMAPGVAPGNRGASVPLMAPPSAVVGGAYIMRPQIAMVYDPRREAIKSRTDIPWHWQPRPNDPITPGNIAMAALHTAPVAATSLTGCISGACELAVHGGYALEEHLDGLEALLDAIDGADWHDLAHVYGEEEADKAITIVGSFFSGLTKMLPNVLSKAVQFVPGIGPVASSALDLATQHLPSGLKAAQQAARIVQPGAAAVHPGVHHPTARGRLCIPATFE
jgi:hypothetical protein